MKCYLCNKEWPDIVATTDKYSCPYCGNTDINDSPLPNALKYIRKTFGNKIFKDKRRLLSLLSDLMISDRNLIKIIDIIEEDNFHEYYINAWKAHNLHEKYIVLNQAHKYLIGLGLRDEIIETIDYSYQVAWEHKFEPDIKTDFKDRDNTYYILGRSLEEAHKYIEAVSAYKISFDAGNINSLIELCKLCNRSAKIHRKCVVEIESVKKRNGWNWLDGLDDIKKITDINTVIETIVFNVLDTYDSTIYAKKYLQNSCSFYMQVIMMINGGDIKYLHDIFKSEINQKNNILTTGTYEELVASYAMNKSALRFMNTDWVVDRCIQNEDYIEACYFATYSLKSFAPLKRLFNIFLYKYDFISVFPENKYVYSACLKYYYDVFDFNNILNLLLIEPDYYEKDLNCFELSYIYLEIKKDEKKAYKYAKRFFNNIVKVHSTCKGYDKHCKPNYEQHLLEWYIEASKNNAKDLLAVWNYLTTSTYGSVVPIQLHPLKNISDISLKHAVDYLLKSSNPIEKKSQIIEKLFVGLYMEETNQKESFIYTLESYIKLDNCDYEMAGMWICCMQLWGCPEIYSILEYYVVNEEKFSNYSLESQLCWNCLYLSKITPENDEFSIKLNDRVQIINERINQIEREDKEIIENEKSKIFIRRIYTSLMINLYQNLKRGNISYSKALISNIDKNVFLKNATAISARLLVEAISLFINQNNFDDNVNIEVDYKFAFVQLNNLIKAYEDIPNYIYNCEKGYPTAYRYLAYMYVNGLYVNKDIKIAEELYIKGAFMADYESEVNVEKMGYVFCIAEGVLYSFPGAHSENSPKSVDIPKEVVSIAPFGMRGYGFEEVYIPSNVKVIGKRAFIDNNNLVLVNIENGVEELQDECFNCEESETDIHIFIPRSVKLFGESVFSNNVVIHCKKSAPVRKYAESNDIRVVIA